MDKQLLSDFRDALRAFLGSVDNLTAGVYEQSPRAMLAQGSEWRTAAMDLATAQDVVDDIALAWRDRYSDDPRGAALVRNMTLELVAASRAIHRRIEFLLAPLDPSLRGQSKRAATRRRNAELKDILNGIETNLDSIIDALGDAFPILRAVLKGAQEVVAIARG